MLMKKLQCNILPLGLLLVLSFMFLSSCGKKDGSERSDILKFSDDTTAAAQLVADANEDLNKIKILYNENEAKREELTNALKNNEIEKVRSTSNDLIDLINGGMVLGKSAVEKIDKAREMDINSDFKEYLRLKSESLQREMNAFEKYREAAGYLRDKYDPKDEKQRAAVSAKFEEVKTSFQKIMESAQQYSKEANDLAKESAGRNN